MSFKTALLVSTYNWPEALALVFKSIKSQSVLPDQFIIADDGSRPETKQLIDSFKDQTKMSIVHVWHEDKGFRRSSILNKAIAQSDADYIIQTDGDCILHKEYIKDHLSFAKKGLYLYGSRVNIDEAFRDQLFQTKKTAFHFLSKGIKKRSRALHIPILASLYGEVDEVSKKMRGCNLSFWKQDFVVVNGYNEDMTGWGREDSELIIRMMNKGLKGRRLRYKAIVYHIWHSVSSKSRLNINQQIQEQAVKEKLVWCENGIDKYLN